MMLGEPHRPSNPTVGIPPWPPGDDPTDEIYSLSPTAHSNGDLTAVTASSLIDCNSNGYHFQDLLVALGRFLPSNEQDTDYDAELLQLHGGECDAPVDAFSCDEFRMYEFKVRRCTRGRSHDWTECPFAHPGEKARRRDPRRHHYSGTACPEFRKGSCKKGDACEFAHGVFECWLHPARYRTQPCKDGINCRRRVCFFAHTPDQLRVVSHQPSPNPSPRNVNSAEVDVPFSKTVPFMASPIAISPEDSPPVSPMTPSLSRSLRSNSINEMVASYRNMQLDKVKSLPSSWGVNHACGSGLGSPIGSRIRPGFRSMPTTPTYNLGRSGLRYLDVWEKGFVEGEEPAMERVESGRDLRTKMFEKLSKENSLDRAEDGSSGPDVGWVSDLIK